MVHTGSLWYIQDHYGTYDTVRITMVHTGSLWYIRNCHERQRKLVETS